MYLYGVFKTQDPTLGDSYNTGQGVLCMYRSTNIPALFHHKDTALEWAATLQREWSDCVYVVRKFELNPNAVVEVDTIYPTL